MFEIKKDPTRWIIAGTGSGWNLMPQNTEKTVIVLNDYVYGEKYQIKPEYLCIMDVLDEKPQVVAGISNLGELISKINQMKVPLITPFKYEEIPLSQTFPLAECVKEFGKPYFSNTIGYMIAFAMLNFVKQAEKKGRERIEGYMPLTGFEIETYGVNQASSSEYFYEKAGVEYWLGMAVGRGIKVTINGDKSELLTNKSRFGGGLLYGYNQTYDDILNAEKKFGEPIIKRLLVPPKEASRTIRKVNS